MHRNKQRGDTMQPSVSTRVTIMDSTLEASNVVRIGIMGMLHKKYIKQ